jgi:phage gp29-like protein
MADEAAKKKRIIRTGYNDRLYGMGLRQGELAGYVNDPYNFSSTPTVSGNTVISRRDDILITEGGGSARAVEQYTRLFNDAQVLSAFDKLADEIIQREWIVTPASDSDKDEEVAEFVRQVIYRIGSGGRQSTGRDMLVSSNSGFDSFVKGMCESLILGISIAEICWSRQGSYVVPSELKIRDPRRFLFVLGEDGSVSARLVTVNSPVEGLPIPVRSMIIHRHYAYKNLADVYGTGLGRVIYSLVEFRRTLMSFWLQYADKHTTPTAVGKFSLGTPEEEVKSLFTALQRLGQETAIVIPDEMSIEFLKSEGRPELYQTLITYVDQQISFLINGESVVGQDGSTGSYARDQIADSVRIRKAKAFSNQLDQTLNSTLIKFIVDLNYPGAAIPRIYRDFSDIEQRGEDPVKTVQILTQLQAVGYKVTDLDWLRDKLLIPSLEKVDPSEMMGGMEGMSEKNQPQSVQSGESDSPVIGEGVIGRMLRPATSVSADNLDFSEFDESGDLKDQTVRDKVAKKISERFSQGGMDEVGWDRLAAGISSNDAETSKINIDENVSVGDIVYTTKRLLDEIRMTRKTIPPEQDRLRYDLVEYENIALRGEEFPAEKVGGLINTYAKVYRLNRHHVHGECVVLDPEKTGYWSYFAPYFM